MADRGVRTEDDCGEFPQHRCRALAQISTTPACEPSEERLPSPPEIARNPLLSGRTAMLSNLSLTTFKILVVDSFPAFGGI